MTKTDGVSHDDPRIPTYLLAVALISRLIAVVVIVVGILSFHNSDLLISLAIKYVPAKANSVLKINLFFFFINFFYFVPLAMAGSLALNGGISLFTKGRGKHFSFILVTAASAYVFFVLGVQKIPLLFFFLYLLVSTAGLALMWVLSHKPLEKLQGPYRFIRNVFLCIPFLPEFFFPLQLIYGLSSPRLRSRPFWERVTRKAGPVYTATAFSMVICYLLTVMAIGFSKTLYDVHGEAQNVTKGNYWSLQFDKERNRLIASNVRSGHLEIYDVRHGAAKLFEIPVPTEELCCMRINAEKNELYHFDRGTNRLLVYDLASFHLKKESSLSMEGHGSAMIAFDNASQTIAVAREDNFLWIVNMLTLQPIKKLHIATMNTCLIFDKLLDAYVLSYCNDLPFIRIVTPDGKSFKEIGAKHYQGNIASADRFHELFVALPLAGKIAVYDIPTLKIKRMIPTVFGVRGIAFDDAHDLIIAASLCTGKVDIIDRGSGSIRKRMFVGHALREVCLNEAKREAYISSPRAGVKAVQY